MAYGYTLKGGQTIKGLLMAPKDKDPITNKSGVIYRYKCSEDGCEEEYIGESARTFAERFKEHQKSPSPIHNHCNVSGHKVTINNFTIIGREDQNLTSAIKEALFIRTIWAIYWFHLLVIYGAIYWFQYGDLSCDDEYIEGTSRTLVKDTKSTWRTPHPFINTVTIQATPPVTITSK